MHKFYNSYFTWYTQLVVCYEMKMSLIPGMRKKLNYDGFTQVKLRGLGQAEDC